MSQRFSEMPNAQEEIEKVKPSSIKNNHTTTPTTRVSIPNSSTDEEDVEIIAASEEEDPHSIS